MQWYSLPLGPFKIAHISRRLIVFTDRPWFWSWPWYSLQGSKRISLVRSIEIIVNRPCDFYFFSLWQNFAKAYQLSTNIRLEATIVFFPGHMHMKSMFHFSIVFYLSSSNMIIGSMVVGSGHKGIKSQVTAFCTQKLHKGQWLSVIACVSANKLPLD